MTEADTVLAGGTVVTVDDERRVLSPGAVAVTDGRIVAVDDLETVRSEHSGADHIDLEGHVLLPGLVDSHGHAGHALTKNLRDDSGDWLSTVADVYFRATGEAFWRAEGHLAALERLRAGVTTSLSYVGSMPRVDHPRYAAAAAEGYESFGLRHVVAVGPPDPPYPRTYCDPDRGEEVAVSLEDAMETTRSVLASVEGDGRLSGAIAPASLVPERDDDGDPTGTARAIMERVASLSADRDLPVQAHAYGGDVDSAAAAVPDLLSERLSLAHCAGVSTEEITIMADRDVAASHGPLTHAYAWDRFPVVEAMDAGVRVAVSTDGAAPDRSFDLLSQGRVAAQLQRAHHGDTSVLPAGRVLEAMTVDAAATLGMADEVGSLEVGKRADVVAVDRRRPRLAPDGAPVHRLVHYAGGDDVALVMVEGDLLVNDGEVRVGPPESAVLADAEAATATALDRAGHADARDPGPGWGRTRYRRE